MRSAAAGPSAATGEVAFGRIVMIGTPLVTREWTMEEPPKMDCSATKPSPRLTASVRTPESIFKASRAATSLPSAVDATSTASGAAVSTSDARSSAVGATT
jgi:hypothetical protein